jgi:hypothetical protein
MGSANVCDAPDDPCATDTTPPLLTVPGQASSTNATQPGGTNVAYTATATDDQCGCLLPARRRREPLPHRHDTGGVQRDGRSRNTSQASFSVSVRGAPEQIVALLEKLRR